MAEDGSPGLPAPWLCRRDALILAGGALLVAVSVVWGQWLAHRGAVILLSGAEPLMGPPRFRVDAGTLAAIAVAAAGVLVLPRLAGGARWRAVLAGSGVATVVWSVTLALVDGPVGGLSSRLTTLGEYLRDVHAFTGGAGGLLQTFTGRILTPHHQWVTHVGGHPPGALLSFWALDRIGLSGGGAAATWCVLAGASAVPAVLITVRAVAGEDVARAASPFLVASPAAIWIAVSADAYYLGVTAWGIAAFAVAARNAGTRYDLLAVAGGVLLGFGIYLSYGLILLAPVALVAARRARPVMLGALGALAVAGAFTAAGFWWFSGLEQTRLRVAAGVAGARPYDYFLFADLAALAIAVGPAVLVALGRIRWRSPVALLAAAALAAMALADVTGLARGEVERIWLPFMPYLTIACGVLPRSRRWLGVQLAVGLLIETFLRSQW